MKKVTLILSTAFLLANFMLQAQEDSTNERAFQKYEECLKNNKNTVQSDEILSTLKGKQNALRTKISALPTPDSYEKYLEAEQLSRDYSDVGQQVSNLETKHRKRFEKCIFSPDNTQAEINFMINLDGKRDSRLSWDIKHNPKIAQRQAVLACLSQNSDLKNCLAGSWYHTDHDLENLKLAQGYADNPALQAQLQQMQEETEAYASGVNTAKKVALATGVYLVGDGVRLLSHYTYWLTNRLTPRNAWDHDSDGDKHFPDYYEEKLKKAWLPSTIRPGLLRIFLDEKDYGPWDAQKEK